jgi:hypothetical protein
VGIETPRCERRGEQLHVLLRELLDSGSEHLLQCGQHVSVINGIRARAVHATYRASR